MTQSIQESMPDEADIDVHGPSTAAASETRDVLWRLCDTDFKAVLYGLRRLAQHTDSAHYCTPHS